MLNSLARLWQRKMQAKSKKYFKNGDPLGGNCGFPPQVNPCPH
jgi:hypothetical protein